MAICRFDTTHERERHSQPTRHRATARSALCSLSASLGCIARQKSDVTYLCVRDIRQAVAPCSDFTHPSYGLRGARFALSSAICYPPFASIAKGEVFVLLYVFLFVRSTISQQHAGRFTPNFACGRSLGRDVSSPVLGVSDPLGGQKEGK